MKMNADTYVYHDVRTGKFSVVIEGIDMNRTFDTYNEATRFMTEMTLLDSNDDLNGDLLKG